MCAVGGITIFGAVILVVCSALNGAPILIDDKEHASGMTVCTLSLLKVP